MASTWFLYLAARFWFNSPQIADAKPLIHSYQNFSDFCEWYIL